MNMTAHQDSTTIRLLTEWKAKKGLDTDYKAAKALHITQATISGWRKDKSHARPSLAAKMAEDLGMDVVSVLAAIEADRAYNSADKYVWQKFGRGAFVALVMGLSLGASPARAYQPAYQGSQNFPLCEVWCDGIPSWRSAPAWLRAKLPLYFGGSPPRPRYAPGLRPGTGQ